jgi:prephenate dehydratase
VSSTSKAAEIASQDKTGESAALSSFIAAELFGLNVLAQEINDKKGNSTRFFVIRRRRVGDGTKGGEGTAHVKTSTATTTATPTNRLDGEKWKSLVTFTIEHSNPGALANCLTVFSSHGINLTSINTRPSGVRNWHYVFFVEFKGRKTEAGEETGDVNRALGELDRVCRGWRWLGSWENRLGDEDEEEG